MQCEICGKETADAIKIILDGSHLVVCAQCSAYGKREPSRQTLKGHYLQGPSSILEIGDELILGYGKAVRKARESKGITIEELGKIVFEKASFLHRIEAESAKPSSALAKKLENALGIKIIPKGNG